MTESGRVLVLWDIDHTLIENGGASKATYARTFEILLGRLPETQPETHGRTDFEIMANLLRANSIEDVSVYYDRFGAALIEGAKDSRRLLKERGYVLPGVVDALKALSTIDGVFQSVLTGNIYENALVKLETFELDQYLNVEVGGYGSDSIVRSDLVEISRTKVLAKRGICFSDKSTVLIGDTVRDVSAAIDGGARVIGVATGIYSTKDLKTAGANVVLNDLSNTASFIDCVNLFRN
jgi:phosphoglycolate phosphatase-like HAD superfamily hydrolase